MWHHGYGWTDGYGGQYMMIFGFVFWALIIAGIVVLVVWAIRTMSRQGAGPAHGPDALEIARRRYASGEITKEQFEQLRNDLGR